MGINVCMVGELWVCYVRQMCGVICVVGTLVFVCCGNIYMVCRVSISVHNGGMCGWK